MKLYAFWKYDIFPFVLGGPIKKFCDRDYPGKDYVETDNYGVGSYFKPIKIVPLKLGLEIQKQLDSLARNFEVERNEVTKKYKNLLTKQFPDLAKKS